MITVETLETESRLVNTLLHTLAGEGYVNIINEDDEDIGETTLHYQLINYLLNALKIFFINRADCFIAANLRFSYDEQNPLKWYAPDILIAFGVENHARSSYHLPTEKVMPQVIVEAASEKTVGRELGEKYLDYARLGVEEYYLLDPERSILPRPLIAYQRDEGELLQVKIRSNRIFSPHLNLEIVDTGSDFRLFDPENNNYLKAPTELAQEATRLKQQVIELEALLKKEK
jgi:Uma2 family endonuclease